MMTQTEPVAEASTSALPGSAVPAARSVAAPARRKGDLRPVPVRSEDYAHLSIDGLRAYRRALADEENKVSYWRRILQARLDVVASGGAGKELDRERLAPVLTSERVGSGRSALVEILPVDDIPPLPSLAELWDRRVAEHDEVGRRQFEDDLREAEAQLSAYRSALHQRIGTATGELIARYREQPDLCLSALPLEPARRASA